MILELIRSPPWSRYDYYYRRRPDYSTNTPGRAANRLRFTEAAISVRGQPMTEGFPPAAIAVAETKLEKAVAPGPIAPLSKSILNQLKIEKEELEAEAPIVR